MPEVSLATRHVMQANKSKNTKPELQVRESLRAAGLAGYRLHWKQAPGKPDICYPGRRVAIFVDGCYWHRCPYCALPLPKSNVDFWTAKFARNRARDERNTTKLVEQGWKVVRVWECRLKKERASATLEQLAREVRSAEPARGRKPAGPGREVLVGAPEAWRLARARKRLSCARTPRHRYNG